MSPINPIVLQRRHAELGRIRLGDTVETQTKDGPGTRPRKLDTFRFTSPSGTLIEQIAALYGGQMRAWDNDGKAEWEVTTDAKSVPVIVVKGGFSQWMETWSGGGCVHRCDGVTNQATQEPCVDDGAHQQAKPYTRLSVMLRDVESLGVWRMETHGWNAAAELPSMAELAMFVGDLVPATLHLVERTSKIKVKGKITTAQYVVPVLDLAVSKARLVELVTAAGTAAIGSGIGEPLQQIGAEPARPNYDAQLFDARTVEQCQAIWHAAGAAGHLDEPLKARINARATDIKAREDVPYAPDAVSAISLDVDAVWQALVVEAGKHGVTDSQLREMLEQEFAQPVDDLDDGQLQAALDNLKTVPVP